MAKAVIPHDYQGQPVAFDASGWLHATAIAERFGKRLDHWMENAETLAYVRALDEVMTGHKTGILDTRKSGYVKTSRDQLNAAELESVTPVEQRDTALLGAGMSYAKRKANLLRYAQTLQTKHLTEGNAA